MREDKLALQRLREAAEKAKIELSSTPQTEVNLPFITADQAGPKHLNIKLSRAKLEALVEDLVKRTVEPCKQALKDAGLTAGEIDEVILVGGMTRMPQVQETVKSFFGREPHKGVNPDEVVAIGAAIQGGVLKGDVKDVLLLDVTPLSLGIETMGSVMTKLIERNTVVPTTKKQTFSTTMDSQEIVEIGVFEGERPCTDQNHLLGEFEITGIERAKAGEAQIEVTFALDANGVLHVTAQDQKTKAKAECTINNACKSLSKEEIARMLSEATKMEESDAQFRKKVEVKGELESLAYDEDDDAKRDELLAWLDKLDLAAVSLSSLESKLAKAQRRAEEQ